MYEAFYGLKEKPFNLTPDPKFVYLSEKHKEAFAHLLYGIKNRAGFVMVTGEIGTGKTTICRTLVSQLDDATEVAFIFNPCLSPDELLRKINEDFGIKTKADTIKGLIDELNAYLLDRNAQGKNCVLVIDEAQDLTPGVLEQIRLLSNLETETQKLLQIVLIGQPELNEHLALDELRQLNQRITARYHLQPLNFEETVQYISYRLRVAGARRRIHFARSAFSQIFKYSKGTPRVINAICDRALLIGYTRETHNISADVIKQAAREIQGEKPKRRKTPSDKPSRVVPALAVAAVLFLVIGAAGYAVNRVGFDRANAAIMSRASDWLAALRPAASAGEETPTPASDELPPGIDPKEYWRQQNLELAAALPPAEKRDKVVDPNQTFADVLDSMDPAAARTGAAAALLRSWNMAFLSSYPKTDEPGSFVEFATEYGLVCEVLRPSLEQIEMVNLPALVRLRGNKQSVWCALIGVEEGKLRITSGMSDATLVDRQDFKDHYMQDALILWRDPSPEVPTLKPDMHSDDVQILQAQLRTLGLLSMDPNGTYDKNTQAAVQQLQADTGLHADGVAGRQTRMVLCSWLPGFDTPELRQLPPLWSSAGELVLGSNRAKWPAVKRPENTEPDKPVAAKAPLPSLPSVEPPAETDSAPAEVVSETSETKETPLEQAEEPPMPAAEAPAEDPAATSEPAAEPPADTTVEPEEAPAPSADAMPETEAPPPEDAAPAEPTEAEPTEEVAQEESAAEPEPKAPVVPDARNSTFPLVPSEAVATDPATEPAAPADTSTDGTPEEAP